MELKYTSDGHIEGWEDGRHQADIAWWQGGESKARRVCGITTEAEAAELMRQIATDSDKRPCWTALRTVELTDAELEEMPQDTVLHFTNWPGKPTVPVTRVNSPEGNIQFAHGKIMTAFADELTRWPRAGLEA